VAVGSCPDEGRRGGSSFGHRALFGSESMYVQKYVLFCILILRITTGYGSPDLRLYTSTKLKIFNYWLYSHMYKNKIYI
jgi:hypothetical protein